MKNISILIVSRSRTIARYVGDNLKQQGYLGQLQYVTEGPHIDAKLDNARPDMLFVESCFYHNVTANMLARLVRKYKDLRIAVFAVEDCSPHAAARFIYWGVESYVNLRDAQDEYRRGLDIILGGGIYVPSYVAEITETYDEAPSAVHELTPREQEIVRLIAAGKSSDEIARTLDLKPKTVKNHKASMYEKCNVRNSIELLHFAMRRGILSPEDLCS